MKLCLQRKLLGDAGKWRTVCRFTQSHAQKIENVVATISQIDDVQWRIVIDDNFQQQIAYHDGRQWVN